MHNATAPPMDTCQANSREFLQQAIDAEIKSLEESIRSLKYRRNALAPISSLPTEVIFTIFSILRVPVAASPLTPPTLSDKPDNLPWFRISHVCRHWREIALNQPLFWNQLYFNNFSSAGAAGILARAKMAPLYLEARVLGRWNDAQFSAFQTEIRMHTSHISHLDIGADFFHFSNVVEGLVSPAPILEYLSLACEGFPTVATSSGVSIPDTLFDGTTPRLSCLKLRKCDISWKSPFLKGLRYLEIRYPSASGRPSLSDWLDALDEMPQLEMLSLDGASPIALPSSPPSGIKRTITLPSLSVLVFSASARDCGLALAHLILPALTRLRLEARSALQDGSDVQEVLPHVSQHAHGFHITQSMIIRGEEERSTISTSMLAWAEASLPRPVAFPDGMPSAPLEFYFTGHHWSSETNAAVFDAVMAALPLENLLSLTTKTGMNHFTRQVWLHHAQRWPLLQRVCLSPSAAHGFVAMLLEDSGGCENPLLPSLTTLELIDAELSVRGTIHLRDALMKRVEQGVPLEALDLQSCIASNRAVELLREIVVDVPGPKETFEEMGVWTSLGDISGLQVGLGQGDSSGEGYEDYSHTDSDNEEGEYGGGDAVYW
jgi:hypothetical protein